MNVRELISRNLRRLSPQELLVAHYILENLNIIKNSSIKKISRALHVNEAVISKTLAKLKIGGFKQLKFLLTNSYYVKNEQIEEIAKVYQQKLIADMQRTFIDLKLEELEELIVNFVRSPRKIILFATGKTKLLFEIFYFSLLEWGYEIEIYSSLYDLGAFTIKNKIVIVATASGDNSKVYRYLNLIQEKKAYKIIGITATQHFCGHELVDLHLYGAVNSFFTDNPRANPIVEKYPILVILDTLFLLLMQNLSPEDRENKKPIVTQNVVSI